MREETLLLKYLAVQRHLFLNPPPLLVVGLCPCFSSVLLYIPNSHVNSDDKCNLKGLKMHHGYWPAVSYMNC